jgi:hypothetical protein
MSEPAFDPGLLEELQGVVGEVFTELQASGVLFAERAVAYVVETRAGGNPLTFEAPSVTSETTALEPRPTVDARDQWRAGQRVGDAKLTIARAALTAEQLATIAYFLIDDVRYDLVGGWTKQEPMFWELVVRRARA